jgi:RNA-directed DNA polymerase
VTQVNAGRKTAGIDGQVALSSQDRAELADWVQHGNDSLIWPRVGALVMT